ncbi:ATP-binding cassette domain-containing protein, partial [Testudinibacter sp. TR-2022]
MIPVENTIFVNGEDIFNMIDVDVSHIFSFYFQFPDFFSGNLERAIFLDSIKADKEIYSDFKSLGLGHFKDILEGKRDININNFSGGERKRLDILRSSYRKSPIIFFDEPTSSIDNTTSEQVWNYIFDKHELKTIICATHD